MVLKTPIVLVTIPLALALGLIWFRRKKIHCDSGGTANKNSTPNKPNLSAKSNGSCSDSDLNKSQERHSDLKHSISLPIGSTPKKLSSSPALNNNESFDFKFGKSAPIDITPHKTSPKRISNNNIDNSSEIDMKNSNGDTSDNTKLLNSIEENSFESVDLPGSISCRRRFSFTIKTNEPAVVVKAFAMDARDVNKSPQSSFEQLTPPSKIAVATKQTTTLSNKDTANKTTHPNSANKNKNFDKKSKADKKEMNSSEKSNDENVKKPIRALPVASPPLSLCSNKSNQSHESGSSGDSGKGESISSPPNLDGDKTLSSIQTYDFQLHQDLVKFLVGKGGATVRKIRDQTKVIVSIRRHPFDPIAYKLCSIQGTQKQIEDALAMIKNRLPSKTLLEPVDMELEASVMLTAMSSIDAKLIQVNLSTKFAFD